MNRFFAVFFVLSTIYGAFSGTRLHADTFELVTSMDYPPYVTDELPGGGIMTEVVRASFRAAGHNVSLQLMPWKRAYRVVQEGTYPGTYVWAHSEERAQDFLLSTPVFTNANVIFTTLPDLKHWQEIEERHAAGLQTMLCAPLGWKVSPELVALQISGALTFFEPEKVESCLELLAIGRVHLIKIPRMTFMFAREKMLAGAAQSLSDWPMVYEIDGPKSATLSEHVMFTRSKIGGRVRDIFNHGFLEIVRNGTYRRLLDRYLLRFRESEREAVFEELRQAGIMVN